MISEQVIQQEMQNALKEEMRSKRKRMQKEDASKKAEGKRICQSSEKEENAPRSNAVSCSKSAPTNDRVGAVQITTGVDLLPRDYEILRRNYNILKKKYFLARQCARGKKRKLQREREEQKEEDEEKKEEEWFFILARL